MSGAGTGIACMICGKDLGTILCPYCRERKFLCEECYPNHRRLVHPDSYMDKGKPVPTDSKNLTLGNFSWKVVYPIKGPAHLPQGVPTPDVRKKRGKSRKQLDREIVVNYIKNNMRK